MRDTMPKTKSWRNGEHCESAQKVVDVTDTVLYAADEIKACANKLFCSMDEVFQLKRQELLVEIKMLKASTHSIQ